MFLLHWGPLCLKPWNGDFELPTWPLLLCIGREGPLGKMKQVSQVRSHSRKRRGRSILGLQNENPPNKFEITLSTMSSPHGSYTQWYASKCLTVGSLGGGGDGLQSLLIAVV